MPSRVAHERVGCRARAKPAIISAPVVLNPDGTPSVKVPSKSRAEDEPGIDIGTLDISKLSVPDLAGVFLACALLPMQLAWLCSAHWRAPLQSPWTRTMTMRRTMLRGGVRA